MSAALKDLRDRIGSVKNTKKITDAMKLVAAAKVRRAQAAVLGARPFSENLVKVLYAVNSRLAGEDVEVPLTAVRPVKTARAAARPEAAPRRRCAAPSAPRAPRQPQHAAAARSRARGAAGSPRTAARAPFFAFFG